MKAVGIICEYNPLHKGHKYLIDEIKKTTEKPIIAVMSGSFTQRGDVAILSKFERTREALLSGVDLVIELPTPFALSSAEGFSYGGCEILKATKVVDSIFFGSECGDRNKIIEAAKATQDEKVNKRLRELLRAGEYYPSAMEKALREIYSHEIADIVSSANNTLGVEYAKQLSDSNIEINTIKRIGSEHDSDIQDDEFISASLIRNKISKGEDVSTYIPNKVNFNNPAFTAYGERGILQKLRSLTPENLENLPDVSEGLHNRIYEAVRRENTFESILAQIKTKRYTMARLRRVLTCGLLDITKEVQKSPVSYIRILGFSSQGELLLKGIKTLAELPIVVNVAKDIESLDKKARELFELDIRATDMRTIFEKSPTPCGQDFSHGIIKI